MKNNKYFCLSLISVLIFVPSKLQSQDYDSIIKSKKDQRSKEIDKRINVANQKYQNELNEKKKRFFSNGSSRMDTAYPGLSLKIKKIAGTMYKTCPEKTILFSGYDRLEFSNITEYNRELYYKSLNIKFSISEYYRVFSLSERLGSSNNNKIDEVARFDVYAIIPVSNFIYFRNGYSALPGWSQYDYRDNYRDIKLSFGDESWGKIPLFSVTAVKFRDGSLDYRPKNRDLNSKFDLFDTIYAGSMDYYFNNYVEIKSDIISCSLSPDKIEDLGYDDIEKSKRLPELNFIESVHSSLFRNNLYPDTKTLIENDVYQLNTAWSQYFENSKNIYSRTTDFSWVDWGSQWIDGDDILVGRSAPELQPVYSESPGLVFKGPEARGYLGVSIQDVDSVASRELGITPGRGVIVRGIVPKQAADIAGIRPDDVILKIENWTVTPEQTVQSILESYEAGQEISVQLIRNGVNLQVMVKLGQRPSN